MREEPTILPRRLVIAGGIAVCCLVAFLLRTLPYYNSVFLPSFVRFAENDPWYHVRAVEYLVANFPHRPQWDPFALHPAGTEIAMAPLFDYCAAIISLAIGGGHPSQSQIHFVCAWLPAVLGSLVPIPVYFLGRYFRDRIAGLTAAAMIAVLPGSFLQRSFLGYADHHVLEVILTACCLLTMGKLFRTSSQSPHGTKQLLKDATIVGLALGLYLLSWVAGSLLILIYFLSILIDHVLHSMRADRSNLPLLAFSVSWAIAFGVVWWFRSVPRFEFHLAALAGSGAFFIACGALGWLLRRHPHRRLLNPAGLVVLSIACLSLFRFGASKEFHTAIAGLNQFIGGRAAGIVIEARPFFRPDVDFTLRPAWDHFQTTAIAGLLGFVVLLSRNVFATSQPGSNFLVVWTLLTLCCMLIQNRFGYYFVIAWAVLAGVFWSHLLGMLFAPHRSKWTRALAVWLFVGLGILPSAWYSYTRADRQEWMHPDWNDAMLWLRTNKPAPSPLNFLGPFPDDPVTAPGKSPNNGIMCWWDHGYWITAMGQRAPVSNPTQTGLQDAAAFFLAEDEEQAARVMDRLNVRHIVTDESIPMVEDKNGSLEGSLENMIRLGKRDLARYYELYWEPKGAGVYRSTILYYPEFFQLMANRLCLTGGERTIPPGNIWAVHYSIERGQNGAAFKLIRELRPFITYEQAELFVTAQSEASWRIVAQSPLSSCIPLPALTRFRRIYHSPTPPRQANSDYRGVVEVFELHP